MEERVHGLAGSLARAQEAIARARTLSQQLSRATISADEASGADRSTGEASADGDPTRSISYGLVHGQALAGSGSRQPIPLNSGAHTTSNHEPGSLYQLPEPVLLAAEKLKLLQQQQRNTMTQLVILRVEQLTLRRQQLTALKELLVVEVQSAEGTPQQMAAVQQAVSLLDLSLEEAEEAALAVLNSRQAGGDAADLTDAALAVSQADTRAEEVSRMSRQLLTLLREYPRRNAPAAGGQGADESALQRLPVVRVEEGCALAGGMCSICLDTFDAGQGLKALGCLHYCHAPCLDRWLRLRAVCPLCKQAL